MKTYEWLTAMVKKPETWILLFVRIWFIGGILVVAGYIYFIAQYTIAALIVFTLWGIVSIIFFNIYSQHADLENWVCALLQSEWKRTENPHSTQPSHLISILSFTGKISLVPIIAISLTIGLTIGLTIVLVYALLRAFNFDISKVGEIINNYISIILVFIFIAQAWIFYQQYRHMKQPFFKAPLLWTLYKSKSDTDCCILLKNGGTAPIFNISYYVSNVFVRDIWGFKIPRSEKISEDFLPRLDGGFEKEIFGKPIKEFTGVRLAVYISAETLDGHSTRLLFYKAPEDVDFRLAGSVHT